MQPNENLAASRYITRKRRFKARETSRGNKIKNNLSDVKDKRRKFNF